ncbi:MAG: hypothetical protein AB7O24_05485 [Kofleriaceae bacterium]
MTLVSSTLSSVLSTAVLASSFAAVAACAGDHELYRSSAMVAQIERTTERTIDNQTTTTVETQDVHYTGSQLSLITFSFNGEPNGSVRFMYGVDGIDGIVFTDADGDQETGWITYANGRIVRERYEVAGVRVDDLTLTYELDHPDQVNEIAMRTTFSSGAPTQTTTRRYEYDGDGRYAKTYWIDGTMIQSAAVEYDQDDRLGRATWMDASTITSTYVFSYTDDGRLKDSIGTNNGRFEVLYDQLGRIAVVRQHWPQSIITERYQYTPGEIDSWTFSPDLPMETQFDMTGRPFTDKTLDHGRFEPYDIPN